MLLTEFDPDPHACIDPEMIIKPIEGFPETVVSIFSDVLFKRVLAYLSEEEEPQVIFFLHDVDGKTPIYSVSFRGRKFAFVKARLGAPACVGCFEDVIAAGAKRIILTGNCGVLDSSISDCGIIIPTHAFRDEGCSYHYAPPSDEIRVNKKGKTVERFEEILKECGYSFVKGKTWTTDAFYRETRRKMEERKKAGAICVEMECSAMQAMCDFRGVEFFQYFYAGDNLAGNDWDPRSLSAKARLDDKVKIGLLAFLLAERIEREM